MKTEVTAITGNRHIPLYRAGWPGWQNTIWQQPFQKPAVWGMIGAAKRTGRMGASAG